LIDRQSKTFAFGLAIALVVAPVLSPALAAPAPAVKASPVVKASSAAKTSLAQGYQLYQEKKYAEASTALWQAIQKEGAGASAYLYMAHSQYALGHVKQAIPYYRYVRDNFPKTQEGLTAAQYLVRLDPTSATASSTAPSASAPAGTSDSDEVPAGMSSNLLDRIELVRPVMGHPELSKLTISTIRDDLQKLPKGVKKILVKGGIKFCITTSLVDKYPAMGYQEGRGYDGHSLKRCPGMFNGDTVVICERVVDEASNEVEAPIGAAKLTQTFYHEIGHALDSCLNDYSEKDDYRHV